MRTTRRALEAGAAGIIVSNHGGRTVDQLPATLDALPPIVDRVARRVPVLVDGGVRRGTDIVIARALGADAILIGRPYVHGLAIAGAAGVAQVVNILRQELEMAMALLGRTSLDQLDRSVLW
jgi:4-hydroxymandelate oxidase